MMMRWIFLPVLTGIVLALGACREPQQRVAQPVNSKPLVEVACPGFSQIKVRHVVQILIDRSGSVQDGAEERVVRFRTDAAQLVDRLPPATVVFVRYISDKSYRDTELYLLDAIPEEPPAVTCRVTNPFDVRQRRRCKLEQLHYDAQLRCLTEARERIATTLQQLAPERADKTDVWGGIAIAEEVFRTYAAPYALLVVYSDLEDNVKTPLPNMLPGLKGAEVIVRATRADNPAEMTRRFTAFEQRLAGWGAVVRSQPIDLPLNELVPVINIAQR
jgi:hypothetical protein